MPYDIIHWRLRQAKEALAWNTARANLPPLQIAAAIRMELALGRICERHRFLSRVRAAWRAAERDAEEGNSGL